MSAARRDRSGLRLLWGVCAAGGLHAAFSAYWALGGRWLLDTVGSGGLTGHALLWDPLFALWGLLLLAGLWLTRGGADRASRLPKVLS